jgi:flagellar protein FliS
MNAYATQRYFQTSVETAGPATVLLALHDGAIRFGREAAERIRAGDVRGKGERIARVMAIVAEFAATLDHDKAPDLAENLGRLYDYMLDRLHHANASMDAGAVEEVVRLLETLREGWKGAVLAGAPGSVRR